MQNRIVPGWSVKPAGRPVRPAGFAMLAVAGLVVVAPPQPAAASTITAIAAANPVSARPQWVAPGNQKAALRLIGLLQSAGVDGLDPKSFKVGSLKRAVDSASRGKPAAIARANAMLDRALVSYVAALRSSPSPEWSIADPAAVPAAPSAAALLAQAAAAPSLEAWMEAMPFLHHSYAELRRALVAAEDRGDEQTAARLRINLARTRFLPANGRYVLVNTAEQRLYMYEKGEPVDSMRVVVGKPVNPTPMMAGVIRFAAMNPYWYVPPDLAAERIAPHVVKQGLPYLHRQGYVVFSDWTKGDTAIDPTTIDWEAVAGGRTKVLIRQDPGPANAMGRMKFIFPNADGIFLHDTPDKELLSEAARLFSGGCVRLEDAPRLGKWLYGEPLATNSKQPEQMVSLDRPVPVYLAYLTAVPSGKGVVFYDDIYGKDRSELAAATNGRIASR